MLRKNGLLTWVWILLSVIAFGALAFAQDYGFSPQKFIVAGDKAYGFFGPVKFICAPTVVRAQWSDDGAFLLLERNESRATKAQIRQGINEGHARPPEPDLGALLVWSRSQDRLVEVFRYDPRATKLSSIRWIPGNSVALASVVEELPQPGRRGTQPRQSIVELDAKNATKRVLASAEGEGSMSIWVSPAQSFAIVNGMDGEGPNAEEVYRLYRPGRPLTPLVPPKDFIPTGWTKDGESLVIYRITKDSQGKRSFEYQVFEVTTGKATPFSNPDDFVNGRLKREAFVDFFSVAEPGQATNDLRFSTSFRRDDPSFQRDAVLVPAKRSSLTKDSKGKTPALLVTREAEYGAISPNQDAVVYVTRGMVLMRELMEMDGAEFEKVERADAMDRAKQVALGMIMYAGDYDDRAVPNDENWQDNVMPYLKNSGVFDGFNYTFAGGLLTDVQDPAKTELGFVAVSGGRVVAFVDGHVEFQPNKAEVEAALLRRWGDKGNGWRKLDDG